MPSVPGNVSTNCLETMSFLIMLFAVWDDIKDIAADAIKEFHLRQHRDTIPSRSIPYALNARPTYVKINEDPPYLRAGGELKPFQLTGLNWLAYLWSKGENGILADEASSSTRHRTCHSSR